MFLCLRRLTAKPGRVAGPVLPYENGRNMRNTCDPRIFSRNAIPQVISPQCSFRAHTPNPDKTVSEKHKALSQGKHQLPSQKPNNSPAAARQAIIDLNTNPYYQQGKRNHLDDPITSIDSKLLQAQSQFGAVGVAAVAVAAHRHSSGAFQCGFS